MNRMIQRSKKNLKNKKGFTLIELIVVIVIIGILAAIVVPRLTGFQETAKVKSDIATGKTIATAAATMQAQGDPVADWTGSMTSDKALVTKYLQSTPKPEATGASANFVVVSTTTGSITVHTGSDANQVFPSPSGIYK